MMMIVIVMMIASYTNDDEIASYTNDDDWAKFSFIIILLFDVNILIGIFLLIEIIIIFLFMYIFNRISSIIH